MLDSESERPVGYSAPVDGDNTDNFESEPGHSGSLLDDISAFFDDGKTYVEAELAFQKTRLSYAANRGASGLVYLIGALAFLHLALIGLVIGGILALGDEIGFLGSTLIIVGVLLVAMAVLLLIARKKFRKLSDSFKGGSNG